MYYVGNCPVCKDGLLGFRVCGGCHAVFTMCDECEALWRSADSSVPAEYPTQPDVPCPECHAPLVGEPSHWATKPEIETAGFWDAVVGECHEESPPGDKQLGDDEPQSEA